MIKTGLIGKNLSLSYSKYIHKFLGNKNYELLSFDYKKDVLPLLDEEEFFYNLTIPFKEAFLKKIDEFSIEAKETGVVNTIIKRDGKTYGFNTDVDGFEALLSKYNIKVKNKNVLILGTGATSKTVAYVLNKLGVKSIIYFSRTPDHKTSFSYKSYKKYKDINIVINTTPIGKSFDDPSLLNFGKFNDLEVFIDVNYNLMHNQMINKAKEKGAFAVNALYMLVAQAIKSEELFQNITFDQGKKDEVYIKTLLKFNNIALIGHPFAGKTTIGQILAKELNASFIDTDTSIEAKENMTINYIFSNFGEDYFREVETRIIKKSFSKTGYVISLGGGSIAVKENIEYILSNSLVISIDRNINKIDFKNFKNRPLALNEKDFLSILFKRKKLYHLYADIEVSNNKSVKDAIKIIMEKLWKYL